MLKYVVKRVLMGLLTAFIVATLTFFIMNLVPGGPFLAEKAVTEQAQAGLDNSYAVIAAMLDGEAVGFVRLLWDGGYVAYLAEVMVTERCRHNGLASQMVGRLVEKLRSEKKEGWQIAVYLMAAKEKEGFYQRFGFRTRPDERVGSGMDMWLV